MFGIGPMELILIAIVAIVFIGPERLPDVMRKCGRMFVQFRRQANDVKSSFNDVIQDAEREFELERIRELQQKLASNTPTQLLDSAMKDDTLAPKAEQQQLASNAPTDAQDFDYHHDHYVDGKYVKPDAGFIPWDPSMNRPLSEMFPLPPVADPAPAAPNQEQKAESDKKPSEEPTIGQKPKPHDV